MPLVDSTSIIGGPNQVISDWYLGDDRIFSGIAPGLPVGIPILDASLTDAYFTLKSAPNLPDADAIIQKHITQTLSSSGQITLGAPPGSLNNLLIYVFSADYEGLVFVGPVYYWDFRVITTQGNTLTIAQGSVIYAQNVTQTNIAGTPAVFPNSGQPRFRGFLPSHPKNIANFNGTFNPGDFFRNANPVPGSATGWVATVATSNANGFVSDGIVGND